ncbi:hypothetical protein Veis_3150 [Verminephrobacter eiseniae EF01-2]|uniref:Uncharacterized protein n=1 Tax=Verminephrobacter eiseniae (strain EF01-2) TaxID=391735 RepID=A1WMM4_VEREI|nr:hypothetical protein Veis_3150 [Verminephrobacter eiseniae EF01-2]
MRPIAREASATADRDRAPFGLRSTMPHHASGQRPDQQVLTPRGPTVDSGLHAAAAPQPRSQYHTTVSQYPGAASPACAVSPGKS